MGYCYKNSEMWNDAILVFKFEELGLKKLVYYQLETPAAYKNILNLMMVGGPFLKPWRAICCACLFKCLLNNSERNNPIILNTLLTHS